MSHRKTDLGILRPLKCAKVVLTPIAIPAWVASLYSLSHLQLRLVTTFPYIHSLLILKHQPFKLKFAQSIH